MGEAILFNAARTQAIEDNSIESGFVDANGKLILVKHNGVQVDVGNVVGPQGPSSRYELPYNGSTAGYLRIATLDGLNLSNGAHYNFMLSGMGNFGSARRSTLLVHASQRGADVIDLKAWGWDIVPNLRLYTRKLSTYFFEIWVLLPSYQNKGFLTELASWNTVRYLDSFTTTAPSNLVEVVIQNSDYSPKAVVSDRSDSLSTNSVKTGVLEATYRGGKAKVKVDGVLSEEAYGWLGSYDPRKSRKVSLVRKDNGFVISGQVEDEIVPIALNNSYVNAYSASMNDSTYGYSIEAQKLSSGLVVLKGLLRTSVSTPPGTVIGYLPEGYRPDKEIVFGIDTNSDTPWTIGVLPTGDIAVFGSATMGVGYYISLDGLAFWAAGVAQWIDVGSSGSTLNTTNFEIKDSNVTKHGYPGFWKDPYGFVWFRGVVNVKATVSNDNTRIVNLPAEYRSNTQEHLRSCGNGGYAGLGSQPDKGLVWKPNSPSTVGSWISLSGGLLKTTQALNSNPWVTAPALSSGWAESPSIGSRVEHLVREDGLRMLTGFFSNGTIGNRLFIPAAKEMHPLDRQLILARISNNARARVDIRGTHATQSEIGGVFITTGSAAWFTLDGAVYVP